MLQGVVAQTTVSAGDWMNRLAPVWHLIARIRFFYLGARLDTKKHAA